MEHMSGQSWAQTTRTVFKQVLRATWPTVGPGVPPGWAKTRHCERGVFFPTASAADGLQVQPQIPTQPLGASSCMAEPASLPREPISSNTRRGNRVRRLSPRRSAGAPWSMRSPGRVRRLLQMRKRQGPTRLEGLNRDIAAHLAHRRQVQQLADQEALVVLEVRDDHLQEVVRLA